MDDHHICITTSEAGEVTFFDVQKGKEVASVELAAGTCIDHMLLASHPSHSTHLLVSHLVEHSNRESIENLLSVENSVYVTCVRM